MGTTDLLLVEDDEDIANFVQAVLSLTKSTTYQVTHVTTLGEAQAAFTAGAFDIVLLDLGLPDVKEPMDAVRAAVRWEPEPCVVVLTARKLPELGIEAVREGAHDFILKTDVTPQMFDRVLTYAVERHRHRLRNSQEQDALHSQVDNLQAYVSSVSHDLRSPLSSASMLLQFLRDRHADLPADQLDDFLAKADASIKRGLQFANDLLEDARLGGEGRQALDLPSIALEAAAMAEVPDDRPVRIGPFPEGVWGRPPSILQIFTNLLANAGRHSSPDSETSIHIWGQDEGTTVQLIVDDNGAGVPTERSKAIFEPGVSGSEERTGIGLNTVTRQAATHGGRVWVEQSETLGGARFVVSLPMRSRSAAPDQ